MTPVFTDEQVVQLILNGQQGIQAQLALLVEKVDKVMCDGCAHRPDDNRRIEALEAWRDRGIIGVIGLAIGLLVALLKKG